MKVTILGCGTSTGVPVIGCPCGVCRSKDSKNHRTRASILIETAGKTILVDTSTDLRVQALKFGIKRVDAVLYTHTHADHIHGVDELRTFNFIQDGPIPCFAPPIPAEVIRNKFDYIFAPRPNMKNWVPNLTITPIVDRLELFGLDIIPLGVVHGDVPTYGYLFNRRFAYITDCKELPPETKRWLRDLDVLILDALRFESHRNHMSINEAVSCVEELKPRHTILTHLGHQLDYAHVNFRLPSRVELGYDGMVIEILERKK